MVLLFGLLRCILGLVLFGLFCVEFFVGCFVILQLCDFCGLGVTGFSGVGFIIDALGC